MNKKLIVLQEDKNDCAAASLLSIIRYYNGNLDLETIRKLINTTKNGTNAFDLMNGAKEIGLESKAYKLSFESLINLNTIPLLAHVKKSNMYHFIVIYKINNKKSKILIMDPSIGLKNISFKEFEQIYLNVIIMFKKTKELPKIKNENKILKIILKTLQKNKLMILKLSLLSMLSFIFCLSDYFLIKIILDKKLNTNIIQKYIITFLSLIIIKNALYYLRNKLLIKINYIIENNITIETLKNLFNLPYSYYKNKSTGEVVSRINDLNNIKDLLSNFMLNTFVDILFIIVSFIIMSITNKYLTLINVIIIFIYLLIVKFYSKILKTKVKELQEMKGYYNEILTESIDNVESINNLNIKNIKINKLINEYDKINKLSKKLNNTFNLEHLLKNLTYDIFFIIYLLLAYIFVLKNKITMSELILLYMLSTYFISIIKSILDKDLEIYFTNQNIGRVNSLFIHNEITKQIDKQIKGSIKIKNVSYSYGSILILNKINLTVPYKSKIILTGKSGSGKSTLVKLILKYLKNYKGKILINNTPLEKIDTSIIQNSITYIGQNEQLFKDTFKNNIILNRNITENEYNKILNICYLNEVKNKKSFKDESLIEQSGFNLSGGERQRIILARALLNNFNYLIIDEALSEVDLNLEQKIIKNILKNYKDKTIIYISHKNEIKNNFKTKYNIERRSYE